MSLSLFRPFAFDMDDFFNDELTSRRSSQNNSGDGSSRALSGLTGYGPKLDVHETDKDIVVHADMPGVHEDDVHISLHNGVLSLSAERQYKHKEEKEDDEGQVTYRRIERSYGKFERRLRVPKGTTEDDVSAHLEDGVLELVITKPVQEEVTPKRIAVKRRSGKDSTEVSVDE